MSIFGDRFVFALLDIGGGPVEIRIEVIRMLESYFVIHLDSSRIKCNKKE